MTDVSYHGTRAALRPGEPVIVTGEHAYFSPNLDAAIWAAELADGDDPPRVYRVKATGDVEDTSELPGYEAPPHPAMSWRTTDLVVVDEVLEWTYYHGTRAELRIGDLLEAGHAANFGPTPRLANYVYFTRTLDASIWGAELALGDARPRIYIVEPTGEYEDDPNLTNVRFRGNPTKSFRSTEPLRIVGELTHWVGHPAEVVEQMRRSVAGRVPDD